MVATSADADKWDTRKCISPVVTQAPHTVLHSGIYIILPHMLPAKVREDLFLGIRSPCRIVRLDCLAQIFLTPSHFELEVRQERRLILCITEHTVHLFFRELRRWVGKGHSARGGDLGCNII
jgi:hypothetical protein